MYIVYTATSLFVLFLQTNQELHLENANAYNHRQFNSTEYRNLKIVYTFQIYTKTVRKLKNIVKGLIKLSSRNLDRWIYIVHLGETHKNQNY